MDWIEPCNKNCSFCFLNYADVFGVARLSIGRVFREMDNESYIKARARKVSILDKTGLSILLR